MVKNSKSKNEYFQRYANDYKKTSEKVQKTVVQVCKQKTLKTLKQISLIARVEKQKQIWIDPRFKVSNYWCSKHIKPHLGRIRARKWCPFMKWLDKRIRNGNPLYSEEVTEKYESTRKRKKSTRKTCLRHIRQRLGIKMESVGGSRTLWSYNKKVAKQVFVNITIC